MVRLPIRFDDLDGMVPGLKRAVWLAEAFAAGGILILVSLFAAWWGR